MKLEPAFGPVSGGFRVRISTKHAMQIHKVTFAGQDAKILRSTGSVLIVRAPRAVPGVSKVVALTRRGKRKTALFTYQDQGGWKVLVPFIKSPVEEVTDVKVQLDPTLGGSLGQIYTNDPTTIFAVTQIADANPKSNTVSNDATQGRIVAVNEPVVFTQSLTSNRITGTKTIANDTNPYDCTWSPSGRWFAVTDVVQNLLTVVETSTSEILAQIEVRSGLTPDSPMDAVSVTPDGRTLFVVLAGALGGNFGSVFPVETETWTLGSELSTAWGAGAPVVTPDGKTLYVIGQVSYYPFYPDLPQQVSIIDVATWTLVGGATLNLADPYADLPYGGAATPNGKWLFVACIGTSQVCALDISSENQRSPIVLQNRATFPVDSKPYWLAPTPDSRTMFAVTEGSWSVVAIDVATNSIVATLSTDALGQPQNVVLSSDPAPLASFRVSCLSGSKFKFDASTSVSPIGSIARYTWDFGDGSSPRTTTSPVVRHTFPRGQKSARVRLFVTNTAGTSTRKVWSSRFMSNNGGPSARTSRRVQILSSRPKGPCNPCECG